MAISNLSYDGDFRMIIGENPNKVKNIVDGQVDLFRQLYSPVINAQSNYMELANGKKSSQMSSLYLTLKHQY